LPLPGPLVVLRRLLPRRRGWHPRPDHAPGRLDGSLDAEARNGAVRLRGGDPHERVFLVGEVHADVPGAPLQPLPTAPAFRHGPALQWCIVSLLYTHVLFQTNRNSVHPAGAGPSWSLP